MAGLGSPMAAPQPPAPAPAVDQGASPTGEEQATPEEQAQYDQFVGAAMDVIYPKGESGSVSAPVMENLRGSFAPEALQMFEVVDPPVTDSPVDSVAATAVLLTALAENAAGQDISDDVVMHGGVAIIEELVEVAEAAKIHDFSEQEMEAITYRAMDLYRQTSPRVDQEALSAEFAQLLDADQRGELSNILPGLPGGAAMGA